jgi:RNA polymerase sigma-70 factor (ECF subfamily)
MAKEGSNRSCGARSDNELVERIRLSDTALYEILAQRSNPVLRRWLRRFTWDTDEVEELIQETHYWAFSHLYQFAGRASFLSWLVRIGTNQAISCRRRAAREPCLLAGHYRDRTNIAFASVFQKPEHQVMQAGLRRMLRDAIANLPEAYRSAFLLVELEEMTPPAAAIKLHLSIAGVKTRLHRARNLLRQRIRTSEAGVGLLRPR